MTHARALLRLTKLSCLAALIGATGLSAAHAQGPTAPPKEPPAKRTDRLPPQKKAEPPTPRATPLQLLMKDGIPENTIERVRLRDSLYALLSTAKNEKEAKQIAGAIQRLWLTSGSDTVDLMMERAIKAFAAKKADLSIKLLNATIELAPDYAEAWNRRAYIRYRQNDLRAAAGDLRRVLALDPKHYKALDGLGTILRESGNDAGALKVYERLMDINPFSSGAKTVYEELKKKVEGRGI